MDYIVDSVAAVFPCLACHSICTKLIQNITKAMKQFGNSLDKHWFWQCFCQGLFLNGFTQSSFQTCLPQRVIIWILYIFLWFVLSYKIKLLSLHAIVFCWIWWQKHLLQVQKDRFRPRDHGNSLCRWKIIAKLEVSISKNEQNYK